MRRAGRSAVTRLDFLLQTKKGADGGFDGMVWFGPKEDRRAVVSVKGGRSVTVEMVRSLDAVVTAQKADVGVLLSLEEPTAAARDWAAKGGLCDLPGFRPVPRLQIVTIEQALTLRERAVDLPTRAAPVRTAPREQARPASGDLFG